MRRSTGLLLALAAALVLTLGATLATSQEDDRLLVVTSLQPTFSIASALAEGTSVDIVSVPARAVAMAAQPAIFGRANAERTALLAEADAVITVRSIWPDDPLFRLARAENIRVVEIDAATPVGAGSGVAQIARPASAPPWRAAAVPGVGLSPHVWLGPSNGIRMAEIVAADLVRLAPDDAAAIEANLRSFRAELQALKAEYEATLATLADVTVYALSDQFDYLLGEFGFFVDGHFLEQDIRWTAEDYAGLTEYLTTSGISVVIHQWQPAAEIVAAIEAAGATLLVLDAGDQGPANADGVTAAEGYEQLLRSNLDALRAALAD
ncbi:MAG: metal ABC transporter substrate-binding protein [Bauldia sp.]